MTAKIAHLPPTAEGLDTVDCTGVQIGNSDIEASSTQGGAVGEFERVSQCYPPRTAFALLHASLHVDAMRRVRAMIAAAPAHTGADRRQS